MLVAEKHRLAMDNHILRSRLVCIEHEKNRFVQDLEKVQRKLVKVKQVEIRKGGYNYALCVVVSAVISFIVVKLLS